MPLRSYRTFQTLILSFLGLFLLTRLWDGRLLLYINQRFVFLVMLAALGILAIAQVLLRDREPIDPENHQNSHSHEMFSTSEEESSQLKEHQHDSVSGWNLWWLSVPLILGLLVPVQPLGSSAIDVRGISTNAPMLANPSDVEISALPAAQRSILDWLNVFSQTDDLHNLLGEDVDVTGFVVRGSSDYPDQFLLGRFTITCCVADAFAVGLVVVWPDEELLLEDDWVRVIGKIDIQYQDEQPVPVVVAEKVEKIIAPQQPYLYP